MKNYIPLFEEFANDMQNAVPHNEDPTPDDNSGGEWTTEPDQVEDMPMETNHTKYLNSLGHMNVDQIRQEFLEENLSTPLRKSVAAQVLGDIVAQGNADEETQKLFHDLSDTTLEM